MQEKKNELASGRTQNIGGSNHFIAGRDINYSPRQAPTEPDDHPLITYCPQCKKKEWRLSERCWYCEGNVREMWDSIEQEQALQAQRAHRTKIEFRGWISMGLGLAILFAGTQWSLPMPLYVTGVLLGLIGGAFSGVFNR